MKRYQAIYPWIIVVIGAVLRFWNLTALPPWYDESFTLLATSRPFNQMMLAIMGDVHPPAYYLIIWSLLKLPLDSLLILRGFSAVCGVAGLALAWHVSGMLPVSRSARLFGLALLAIHPMAIHYSQEGRMYTWLILLVLVQCWSLLTQRWWLLGLVTLLALYTHNYGLFYSALVGLVGLGYYIKQPRPMFRAGIDHELAGPLAGVVVSMGLALLCYLPWVWVLAGQMGYLSTFGYWLPSITAGSLIAMVHQAWMGYYPILSIWQLVSVPVLIFALVIGFRLTWRHMGLWLLAVGPVALALVVSVLWKPTLLFRGLLPSLPMLSMLGGIAFTQVKTVPGKVGRWLLVLPVLVGMLGQVELPYVRESKSDLYWPPDTYVPGPVIHLEDTSYITRSGLWPETENYFLDKGCPEQPGSLTWQTRNGLGYSKIEPENLPSHYYLAAVVGVLSTRCIEDTWHQLADNAKELYRYETQFGTYGVWEIGPW